MGLPIAFAVIAVAVFFTGLLLGHRQGTKLSTEAERKVSEARESGLREQLDAAQREITELRPKVEELAAARQELKSEQDKYAQMKADVDTVFKGAAADALRDNTQSFLTLAKKELGAKAQEAENTLALKEQAIKSLIDPLNNALKNLDEQTRAMEKERSGAYFEVKTLVDSMQKTIPNSIEALRNETSQLISALRAPKTRGNWGELQLRRCVEYAGMVQYCSFAEQTSARTEDDRLLRPDMMIQLPNGRTIIVDAKTPLDAFLNTSESVDPTAQTVRFAAHAERVKSHLRDLSSKAYWKQFEHTPEFVICFLPSEALFSAALEADPSLIEFGSLANVVMATPTTLIALLKAIAYGWQQSEVTQNAKKIQEAGRDLYSKLVNAHQFLSKMGNALENAVGNYNKFIGAVEGRGGAFFHARKLGALVHDQGELELLESLPAEPRLLTAEDWPQDTSLALAAEAEDSD